MSAWQVCQPLQAATYYWDTDGSDSGNLVDGTNLGGSGAWDTAASNWWPVLAGALTTWGNTSSDTAIFGGPLLSVPAAVAVSLASGITSNQVQFQRSGYTLSGGSLTLAGTNAGLAVTLGDSAVINSLITGSDGLTKTGGGSVRLANAGNTYTGTTTIANGTLIISAPGALGTDTSAISILTNNNTPQNANLLGFTGGSLVLDGTSGGFTFSRNVNFEGRGPIGDRGAAIASLGNNTLSGTLTAGVSPLAPATFRNSRINSINGMLNMSGAVVSQGTSATTFLALGGVNSAGVGDFNLTGTLSGTGSIEKSGAGVMHLNPTSLSGFSGTIRVAGSSAGGQQSSLRVTQTTVGGVSIFGGNTGTNAASAIDLNGGVLEFRSESDLNYGALSTGKNVYLRGNSTVFTGPAVGGQAINGTTTLGTLRVAANTTATFNSRNGFGATLGTWTQESSNNPNNITNNMGGTLIFTGDAWNNNDGSDRTLTMAGGGNTVITGSINTSGAGVKALSKSDGGTLTINGTATTLNGAVNITNGEVVIRDFRSLNNNTANINIGATGTSAALLIGSGLAATAAGLTTSKVVNLAGTTGGASIYANQSGTSPVIFNAAFTATGAGSKTLTLGGSSVLNNIINGAIVNNSGTNTTALTKVGPGTWVLAGANTYTGTTTITNGVLKLQANAATSTVLPSSNAVAFGQVNQFAGSTFEFVGQNGVSNLQTLGTLSYAAGSNTLKLTPGAGGSASLTFANLNTTGASTINVVGADFTNNKVTLTQINSAAGTDGIVTRSVFWNGADYAFRQGGVLRAPNYGVDTGTSTTATGPMTASSNVQVTGSFATNNVTVATIKFNGAQTLTINSGQTLTLNGAGLLATGGASTVTGGTLALGTGVLVARVNQPGDLLTIDSIITGSGGLTKSGAGTLILTGANTRTGSLNLDEGTIRLSGSGVLSGANVTTTIRQGATLDLNGVGTGAAIGQFNNNGVVTNSSATAATLTLGNNNGTGTSYGVIQDGTGVVNVTKLGTGAQSWLGSSSYTGVTTIGGTGLVTVDTLANGGQPSGIGASTSAAANLVFDGSAGGLVYQGNEMNGNLVVNTRSATTDRLFTLAGTGATLSSTAANNNAIVWSNTGAIVHAIVGPQALVFTGTSAGDNTFNPQLTDSGTGANVTSLTKTGAGQWNLGNTNNTYTGATRVGNGVLALNQAGALPSGSPVVLGDAATTGILQTSGLFARNLAVTPAAGVGTITWGGTTGGGGFAAHTTSLTVTLDAGAGLTWGSGGFVPTGASLIFNSASALADVTFTNPIDLGAVLRTITVNDNANTGADYATLSGVLSGTGGSLLKAGGGVLRVTGANTYTGTTAIEGGTLVVSRLGSSGDAPNTATSVGLSGVAMGDGNAIVLGNATTAGGVIQYVGAGEVSDRKIRIRGTTASNQIHADGAGPLILTNVAHDTAETGAKTLFLRGSSPAANMITSQLSDNGAGVLAVTVDGGTAWILNNPGNSYTGTTTASGGALGIGHNTALGSSVLTISNGNVFAYGGDRTLTNTLNFGNNATSGFIGDYSLTFNGTNNLAAGANNLNVYNSLPAGKSVTLNGLVANSLTGNRTWTLDGPGETVINGDFTTSTAFGVAIVKTGDGTLTLGTNGAAPSSWNQAGVAVDIDRGTLKFTSNNAIPSASSANGGLTLSPEIATFDTAVVDLNGTSQTVNALTATTDGTVIINNTSSTASALRFGANNTTVNFGGGIGTYSIQNTGTGALDLVKLGSTSATFNSGVTVGNKGVIASEGGGSFIIAGPVTAAGGLRAIDASTLALTGGISNPGLIKGIEVGGGSTLTLLDGAGSLINSLTTLSLGNTGTGTVNLNLNIGDGATDTLTLLGSGALNLGNTITFNMTDAGLSADTWYTLLSVPGGALGLGGFGLGKFLQGATPGGFSSFEWEVTDTVVRIKTGALITDKLYWTAGGADGKWNTLGNWAKTNKDGATPAVSIPGQGNDVVFIADSLVGGATVTTTLEQNFKVNSLTFEASSTPGNTPPAVTINPGVLASSRIEIAPQSPADGLSITTGGPASVTIGTNLRLGSNQTWNLTDAGAVLTINGSLLGQANVTKTGAGRVVLGAAADPTFNGAGNAVITVTAGNLEFTNSGALGTTANSNVASIVVNGGGFYYNNATAGSAATLPHAITLNNGTLSGGGANHVYGGAVTISGASAVNMADSNGPSTNAARNITLSGVVSGSGSLTIDSNNTVSNGNQLGGTLTINNSSSTWSGNLTFNRGSVTIAAAASASVTPANVTFNSFGRLILQGVDGQTINRSGTLTYGAGAVGEFQVDNTTGTQVSDFIVNQNGLVTLGAGGTGASMRIALPDTLAKLNLTGGVTLGGNSSISVSNDPARVLTISSIINDGGSGYSLAINDDAGAWAQTNGIVRLTAANTFTGNISISDGILEFDTVTDVSGGPSSLGNGAAISMAGGILRFIGSASQATNRPITTTGSSTLSANGTSGAIITYNGAITQAADNSLTLAGTGVGIINGGVSQPAGAATADINISSGTWTIKDANISIADDLLFTGGTLTLQGMVMSITDDIVNTSGVLNLNSAGVWAPTVPSGTSSGLYARGGGVINLGANNISGVDNANGADFISLADGTTLGTGTLETNGYSLSIPQFNVGAVADGYTGVAQGSGTITVTSNAVDWSSGIRLYRGTVASNLAGIASILKQGLGDVTLSGDNSGLTGTVAATRLDAGNLILDYTTNNSSKISTGAQLDMRGANLIINGSFTADTVQTVASFTLANGGASTVAVNAGTGRQAVLNLNGMTRAVNSQDGTIRFILPQGIQTVSNGITTDTLNAIGSAANAILGGWATVNDGTGVYFARNLTNSSDGNIVAAVTTLQDNVSSWGIGENISDASGFAGSVNRISINSLRYNASTGAAVNVSAGGVLGIVSGGILITDQVTSGAPSILGAVLASGAQASNVPEFMITQDSASTFTIGSTIGVNNGIIKSGTGVLRLSGSNTYTGVTEIQNGILEVMGGSAIGDTSLVTLADDRVSTLRLLGSETIGRLQGGSATSGLSSLATVEVGSHTLTLNQSSNTTYAGLFTGSGNIVLSAASTSNLAMTNSSSSFTGNVLVNGGLFHLSAGGTTNASSFTVNNLAGLLMDKNGTTTSGNQILDTSDITLNSAIGNATVAGGLWIRRDQGSGQSETVGVVTAASGASYVRAETTTANAATVLSAGNVVRQNSATMVVRGNTMSATSGRRAQFRIIAANESVMIASMIGGAGAAGSVTTSILPWVIAEDIGIGAITASNMGNSLATYTATAGFRPLDLTTEYSTYAAAGATNNVREVLATSSTGLSGRTLNSLVIHNSNTDASTVNFTGSGTGQQLINNSGAFLFTLNPSATASSAHIVNVGGFDDGISTPVQEYVFHVVNPSYAATTPTLSVGISALLVSSADIVKSGRGTLVLSGNNTAGGGARKTTLNEGVLEISSLANIGGSTGQLVFAGGALRLGAGFVDDVSSRSVSFLTGGGTLDTNGNDVAFASPFGVGAGAFVKLGLGSLTLNAASTRTGSTTVTAGTLVVGANNAVGSGALNVGTGATLALGSSSISVGQVTTSGASPAITGTGTITSSSGFTFSNTGDITVEAILAGSSAGLFKNQANVLTLTGLNTYTGVTEVQAGTLIFNSIANVGGGASALGNPSTVERGVIRLGLTTTTAVLTYNGTGHSTNRIIGMQGTTGGATLNGSGTGAIVYNGGVRFETYGNKTLTLGGISDPSIVNEISQPLSDLGAGALLSVLKADTNTWNLSQSSSYGGTTSVNNGILRLSASQNLTGALQFGSANNITTAGRLEVLQDSSFGSLVMQTNSDTNINHLQIASGKTLTINGNAVIGSGVGALSNTRLASSGSGALVVTNLAASATFRVGGSATNGNTTIADLSGLGSLNVSLNTTNGVFRVASTSATNVNDTYSTLTLPANTTVTAATLSVGDGGQGAGSVGQINSLYLGTGSNVFNVNTINIGTSNRDLGRILFSSGTLGSLVVRAADGVGRAAFNMGTGQATGVAAPETNNFDVSGHSADLLFDVVTIGNSSRGSSYTNSFGFDAGTLDMTSLSLSTRTGDTANGAGLARNTSTTMNLGGGSVTIQNGITAMASQAGAYGTNPAPQMTATINISGGNVTIGATSGTAVTMASTTSTGGTGTPTSTATINITGGTVTMGGNVIRGTASGAGVANASIVLNGGSLNMGGSSIGSTAETITFNAQSGTLSGLAQLNGGGVFTKTTAGVLIMGNGNTYTGDTSVTEGTLRLANTSGSATGLGAVTTSAGTTLSGIGAIVAAADKNVSISGSLSVGNGGDTVGSLMSLGTSGTGSITINGPLSFDIFSGQGSGIENGATTADRLAISSSQNFVIGVGSTLNLSTALPIDGSWVAGTSWRLFDWAGLTGGASVTGAFSNLTGTIGNFDYLPDLGGQSLAWDVSQIYSQGLISVVIIPEPSRALLLLIGLMGLLLRRRRSV